MIGFDHLEVGRPHPYPVTGDSMRAVIDADPEAGLRLVLIAGCDRPTAKEIEAMRRPLRLAVLSSPPLAWIALDAGALSWDAPYSPALASPAHGAEIRAGAARAAGIDPNQRGLVQIDVVDRGLVHALRAVSLSREWWRVLAEAVAACPHAITERDYLAAIARDQAAMTTAVMISRAGAVELGGAI